MKFYEKILKRCSDIAQFLFHYRLTMGLIGNPKKMCTPIAQAETQHVLAGHRKNADKGLGGQMAVELALLLPVIIVISLIVAQGFYFISLVQDFSTQARAAVLSCACSAPQDESQSFEELIQERIQEHMSCKDCEVLVTSHPHEVKGISIFSLMAQPITYECELRYLPWYRHLSIAGVEGSHPTPFVFTLKITVDPYKSGVVM